MSLKKKDTEQIRLRNRKEIIDYLRVHAPIARVDMGQALSLSPATVTAITSDLAKEGRLIELPVTTEQNASRGRPRVLIDLAPDALHVLGLKLSINELRIMLGNQKGDIVKRSVMELQTLELSESGLVEAIASAIRTFIAHLPAEQRPMSIGIAVQGVVNGITGEIVWSPALAMKHISIQQKLEELLNLPITVANDANSLAIAILHQRKYQQLKDIAVIMLGYGVGMGMIINGELYLGHHGAAAEFGHTKYNPEGAQCMCGKRGCIEAYIGDYALYRDARALVPMPKDDHLHPTEKGMMRLVELADGDETSIVELFNRAGKVLGHGISNLIALMSPEKILVSGPGVRAFEHLKPGLEAGLNAALLDELRNETLVETVAWHEDLTVLGVLALALQSLDQA